MTSKDENDTWRDTPAYDYEARRERAEAHCRTSSMAATSVLFRLSLKQPPLACPLAFPQLKIYGGKPCVGGDALIDPSRAPATEGELKP